MVKEISLVTGISEAEVEEMIYQSMNDNDSK